MNNFKNKLIPVILSGGKGSRLWPLSRECFPKQYINIGNETDNSLFQKTFLRLEGISNLSSPIIICNEEHRFIVAEQMRAIDIKPETILLEPFGKNTAPAITLAALLSYNKKYDPDLLILSSDHEITNYKAFQKTICEGLNYTNEGRIVTFGISPSTPETGFGYIEASSQLSEKNKASKIIRFIEKPSIEIAKKLFKNNNYFWNSGIFLFKASTIINEIRKFEPTILENCIDAIKDEANDMNFRRINKEIFKSCPNIPIDKAVMEKTNLGTVLHLNCDWKDIGSWKSVWENSEKDLQGNTNKGKTIIKDSINCNFRSESRLIAGIGLENISIIETSDAVLVTNNESTQDVKDIVEELKKNKLIEGTHNKKMYRPWGHYLSISEENTWQVKRIEINPHSSLSLQSHKYRSEHWVVVKGTAEVEINGENFLLNVNESIYVPKGSKHRLSNPENNSLIIIEIQSGSYLGEDDIVRYEDKYGRQ